MTAFTVIGFMVLCMFVGACLWEMVKRTVKERRELPTPEEWEAKYFPAEVRLHNWVRLAGVPPMHECSVCGKVTTEMGLAISAEQCPGGKA